MSSEAVPCTRGRVCGVSAPRMRWSGRWSGDPRAVAPGTETHSTKSAIRITIAAVNQYIQVSDLLLDEVGSLDQGQIRAYLELLCAQY